jgi:hypothetical protein
LTGIYAGAFEDCVSLFTICLPASVENLDGSAFTDSGVSEITIDPGNPYFKAVDTFILDMEGTSII